MGNENMEDITFRFASVDDVDLLAAIDVQSFAVPWPKEAFYNDLASNRFAVYVIMELDHRPVGYCGVWIVLDEAHITNVAVLPGFRGRKLGERLMRKIMSLAAEAGAGTMTLEVRVSNIVALSLYRKLGFQDGGIRKNYYSDNQEDALVMWVNI